MTRETIVRNHSILRLAFICPYPTGYSPSQRFRFEHYLPYLKKEGIQYRCFPLMDDKGYKIMQKKGRILKKSWTIASGFFRRIKMLVQLPQYDMVYIHREAFPAGPPLFEYIISRIMKKKVIFDFDDAIFLTDDNQGSGIKRLIKHRSKIASICRWATKVSCGNNYLAEFAKQYNHRVQIIPTVVNTNLRHNRLKDQTSGLTIGWTGSHSTLIYLEEIYPYIGKLQEEFNFEFIIIANRDPQPSNIRYRYISWNESTEIQDLLQLNIGIMPLSDTEWSRGKCGFKAIQYMALGIPAVVSDVGVNREIVDDGLNGFIISKPEQWYSTLKKLLHDQDLRIQMGKQGREKIIQQYSVESMKENFIQMINSTHEYSLLEDVQS